MFSKKISSILVFSVFILSSCTNEYWRFHEIKQSLGKERQETKQLLQDFSVERIENRDIEILTTPDKRVLDRIVSMIEQSKKQVFVEVYILTEKRIIQALKDAERR